MQWSKYKPKTHRIKPLSEQRADGPSRRSFARTSALSSAPPLKKLYGGKICHLALQNTLGPGNIIHGSLVPSGKFQDAATTRKIHCTE